MSHEPREDDVHEGCRAQLARQTAELAALKAELASQTEALKGVIDVMAAAAEYLEDDSEVAALSLLRGAIALATPAAPLAEKHEPFGFEVTLADIEPGPMRIGLVKEEKP